MDLDAIVSRLIDNTQVIRSLVENIPHEQAIWKPDPETWSMKDVMEHVYNEERIDFRKHLKEMFHVPPQPWVGFRQEDYISVGTCQQALEGFLVEREESIKWLKALASPDWDAESRTRFGPDGDELVMHAGDVLVSWVAHDYLHIRQMNELHFAWNEHKGLPYSVEYAGGW